MRSHFKLMLIAAAATSVFPVTSAFALPHFGSGKATISTESTPKKSVTQSKPRFLTLEEARRAFGPTFGPEKEGDSLVVYGISSPKCLNESENKFKDQEAPLKVSIDPKSGIAQIYYNGSDDSCLDLQKAKAGLAEGESTISLKDLTATTMTGDFESVRLRSTNEDNDRKPHLFEDLLNSENQKIANVSEATRKANEKEASDKRQGLLADFYDMVLTKCLNQGGAKALDESEKALGNLKQIADYVKAKNEEEGTDWADQRMAEINKRRFEAARLIIERGRVSDFAQATDILDKLLSHDDSYEAKVEALYASAVKRMTVSTYGEPSALVEQGEGILERLKEMSDDQDDLTIQNLERDLYASQTARAAKLGADSEEFAAMSDKFKGFLVAHDDYGCLLSDNEASKSYAVFNGERMGDPKCGAIKSLSVHLHTQTHTAALITKQRNEQIAFQQKVAACFSADETALLSGQKDANGNPIRSMECASVMSRAAEIEKQQKAAGSATNTTAASNLTGAGWGQTTSAPTTTPTTNSSQGFSGLLETGVGATNTAGAQNANVKTVASAPQATAPAQKIATPPTVNSAPRRVFRN